MTADRPRHLGAYGLRILGLPAAARWMQPQSSSAPSLTVEAIQAPPDHSPSVLDETHADLSLLNGGRLRATRGEPVARFALPVIPGDAELLHPYLAPAAALAWQWAGKEALHAGAFVGRAGAILLFGEKASGKSSTLAWLAARHGVTVLADDLAVIDGDRVLAGPRSIDLRGSSGASELGATPVRADRHRASLPSAPGSVALGGCVGLAWGPRLELEPVAPRRRLEVLAMHRTYAMLPGDPVALLELAARPMFTLHRTRGPDALAAAAGLLMDGLE